MGIIKLIAALCYINNNVPNTDIITGIEFEDGSGNKFNYFTKGKWNYIDLTGKI